MRLFRRGYRLGLQFWAYFSGFFFMTFVSPFIGDWWCLVHFFRGSSGFLLAFLGVFLVPFFDTAFLGQVLVEEGFSCLSLSGLFSSLASGVTSLPEPLPTSQCIWGRKFGAFSAHNYWGFRGKALPTLLDDLGSPFFLVLLSARLLCTPEFCSCILLGWLRCFTCLLQTGSGPMSMLSTQ